MAAVHGSLWRKREAELQRALRKGRHDAIEPKRPSDARLMMEIDARLKGHPDLHGGGIEVTVDRGEAVLSGSICDDEMKRLAGTIASGVEGLRGVRNELTSRFGNYSS
jgi:osmotically-inducible protein OsmY